MRIYAVYDATSSEVIGYFSSRENAERYMNLEILQSKKVALYDWGFDEAEYRRNTTIEEYVVDDFSEFEVDNGTRKAQDK